MIDISFPQYLMLKRIKRANPLPNQNLSQEQYEIIQYLEEHNFVDEMISEDDWTFNDNIVFANSTLTGFRITEAGKAQISAYTASFHKWWIPLVISIIALFVSIFK